MTLSTRLKYLEKETVDDINIVEPVQLGDFLMEALSKKVSSIPVWNEYDYAKQFELVLNFLENKLETEFVDVSITETEKKALAEEFLKTNNGFGLLDRYLAKPEVSSVMVNSYGSVYIQEYDEFKKTASILSSNEFMEITARFTSNSPITRVRQNNLFITILKPPVSDNMIIINKIKDICESLDDLPEVGQITVEMAEFFKKLLAQRKNIIISGNTQSGICEFIQILHNSFENSARAVIIEDSGLYRPPMDNISSFSVSSLDELDYEFLLDSVSSLHADYVSVDISDNQKFASFYSQVSNTDKGLITAVRAQNIQDVSAKFINSSMVYSKCTEKQAKLKLSSVYDFAIHIEQIKGVGFRIDSVMEITSTKTAPLVMNEIVKFVEGVFVLDLPEEYSQAFELSQVSLHQDQALSSHPVEHSMQKSVLKSFRTRMKS